MNSFEMYDSCVQVVCSCLVSGLLISTFELVKVKVLPENYETLLNCMTHTCR